MKNTGKWVWITWETQRRSLELASRLGCKLEVIEYEGFFRYPRSIVRTLLFLLGERAQVVFVQNPSMILAAVACLWGRLTRTMIVVDRHSTFLLAGDYPDDLSLRLFRALHAFTLRNADLTIVTNEHLAGITRSYGGSAFVLPDPLPNLAKSEPKILGPDFNVVMVSSFAPDEPTDEVMTALQSLAGEGIHLFVTGNQAKTPWAQDPPAGVEFTGFLPAEDYDRLLLSADAVMVLTTEDFVMLCGCYEAVAAGKPLITSNKEVLREYFEPAVFVENDPVGIAEGLRHVRDHAPELVGEIARFKAEIVTGWEEAFRELRVVVARGPSDPAEYGNSN